MLYHLLKNTSGFAKYLPSLLAPFYAHEHIYSLQADMWAVTACVTKEGIQWNFPRSLMFLCVVHMLVETGDIGLRRGGVGGGWEGGLCK